jgi:phosphoglycerate dehydrogenase-like enzyme
MPNELYREALQEQLHGCKIRLAATRHEEVEQIAHADIVTDRAIDEELLECADGLKLFACISAGYDHLPLKMLEQHGVAVTNGSGVHGPNMAEQAIGYILMFARCLHKGWRRTQQREWRSYQARELQSSTVTVVGMGAIGTAIADRLTGFGAETVGVRYTPSKGGPTDRIVGFDDPAFEDALAETDYLLLACPLTETTENLIGGSELRTLPTDAVLVNLARGPIVDTDALVKALEENILRGAALDVTDPEPLPEDHVLWNFKNVLITPHMAGQTPEYYGRCATILGRNIERVRETGDYVRLENQVLAPN